MALPKKIYGLIGYPVKHSLSPLMHNEAFKSLGIDAQYNLFEVKPEGLRGFLANLAAKGIDGLNITIPHKVRAREILEERFPFDKDLYREREGLYYVKLSGAVNTVKRIEDKLQYWNTDALGFLKSLKEDLGCPPQGKNTLVIGCGGAGRAVIAALSWRQRGAEKIYAYDIREEALDSARKHFLQFSHLKGRISFIANRELGKAIKSCQLLVNASPQGMKDKDASPLNKELLHKDLSVYDVVYNRQTALIREAKSLGLKASGGLGMFLCQGAASFELWTAKPAPLKTMREAISAAIK